MNLITSKPEILTTQPSEIHGRGLFAKDEISNLSLICEEIVKTLAPNRQLFLMDRFDELIIALSPMLFYCLILI